MAERSEAKSAKREGKLRLKNIKNVGPLLDLLYYTGANRLTSKFTSI